MYGLIPDRLNVALTLPETFSIIGATEFPLLNNLNDPFCVADIDDCILEKDIPGAEATLTVRSILSLAALDVAFSTPAAVTEIVYVPGETLFLTEYIAVIVAVLFASEDGPEIETRSRFEFEELV